LEETDCSLAIKARERKVTGGLQERKTGDYRREKQEKRRSRIDEHKKTREEKKDEEKTGEEGKGQNRGEKQGVRSK
jgi:hypothetical protein